ncbi:MAG: DUF465 domain-containing protein [Hyphomicrobiaceae bacterium]|nr:DUF465 domain-containing protein [Hyphomicrobiaceae bacterium]
MSLSSHLAELTEKHRQIDARISEYLSRPVANEAELLRLKREKLKLKDKIESLRKN